MFPNNNNNNNFGNFNFSSDMSSLGAFNASLSSLASTIDVKNDQQLKAAPHSGKTKRRKWKKPKGKPKRPLSAYNLFFQQERERLVNGKEKIGFADMAKNIAGKWKKLEDSDKTGFNAKAEEEQKRYKVELERWEKEQQIKKEAEEAQQARHASAMDLQQQNNMLQTYLLQQQVMMQMQAITHGISAAPQARSMSMPQMLSNAAAGNVPDMSGSRRFSMPTNTLQTSPKKQSSVIRLDKSPEDSDSSLDDETSDLLLNMPIMDFAAAAAATDAMNSRRSSMPNLGNTKRPAPSSLKTLEEDFDMVVPMGNSHNNSVFPTRSMSMPQASGSVPYESLLSMLDEDDRQRKGSSAV